MRVLLLLLSVAASACSNLRHVQLDPVEILSSQARREAYLRLRPKERVSSIVYYQNLATGAVVGEVTERPHLILGDDTRIDYPEDLLVVVPADSATARAAERATASRARARLYTGVSAVAGVGALGLLGSPLVLDASPSTGVRMIGGLIGSAAAIVFAILANGADNDGRDQGAEAFETYDADLRDHLGLCADSMRTCASDSGAPGDTPRR